MDNLKEFVKGMQDLGNARILTAEEQEMVGGGACEGVSCKNSCEPGRKKGTDIKDNDVRIGGEEESMGD